MTGFVSSYAFYMCVLPGANVNATKMHQTALHLAARQDSMPMVELLLDAGMDSVADLAFPVGGASLMGGGGRQLPTWLRFVKFVCQNERIRTHAPGALPLDPSLNSGYM